jgi:signal peptidase I
MNIRWFYSRTVRHAAAMRKHVWKLLQAQKDILSPQAVDGVNNAIGEMDAALKSGAPKTELEKQMAQLEAAANKWLKPYPNPVWRENIEVALVALVVAIGIRTFFVQPFKIPTGSMQPTLFGVTHENLIGRTDIKDPGLLRGLYDFWIYGISYKHVVAKSSGALEAFEREPSRFLLFNLKQKFQIGQETYTVWFPPDKLLERAGLVSQFGERNRKVFSAGEDIIKLRALAGDHLFVDRLTYNFRHPRRGEIIVFETHDVPGTTPDTYYIKRLVALGNERVQIGDDHHVLIDGKRLDASTPGFENVYSFDPNAPPRDSQYYGHVDGPALAPIFAYNPEGVTVRSNCLMVMGDNTLNSADSRAWGDFPEEKVMGKSFFVYWPISKRFGVGYR